MITTRQEMGTKRRNKYNINSNKNKETKKVDTHSQKRINIIASVTLSQGDSQSRGTASGLKRTVSRHRTWALAEDGSAWRPSGYRHIVATTTTSQELTTL
jgi:hypothetical protein